MKCGTGVATDTNPGLKRSQYYPGLTLAEMHLIQRGLERKRRDHREFAWKMEAEGNTPYAEHHHRLADEYDELLTEKFTI